MITFERFDNEFTKTIQDNFRNGINEMFQKGYFNKFVKVYDTNIGQEQFTSTEGVSRPDYVSESENLKEVTKQKGYKAAFTGSGFGHRCAVSKEVRLQAKDDLTILAEHLVDEVSESIDAMHSFVEGEGHRFLNQAFTTAPVTSVFSGSLRPISLAAPDGQPLLSATHQWRTGGTFDNLLAAAPLTQNVITELERRAGAFRQADGTVMPLNMDTIIVKKGSTAAYNAKQIFGVRENNAQYRPNQTSDINIYVGGYTIIETPYLASDTAYFFMDSRFMSSKNNPLFLSFQQRPQMEGLQQMSNNLDRVYPYFAHMKFGIRNMPFAIFGSAGA